MEIVVFKETGKKYDALYEFLITIKDKNNVKKVQKMLRFLEELGTDLRPPISKHLGENIHELREQVMGYRIYYTFFGNICAVLLICGDKTTQDNDIKEARKRKQLLLS